MSGLPRTLPAALFGQVCLLFPVLFFRSQRALALSPELPVMYLERAPYLLPAPPPKAPQPLTRVTVPLPGLRLRAQQE